MYDLGSSDQSDHNMLDMMGVGTAQVRIGSGCGICMYDLGSSDQSDHNMLDMMGVGTP